MIAPVDIDIYFHFSFLFVSFVKASSSLINKCHKMLLFIGSFLPWTAQKPKSRRAIYNIYFSCKKIQLFSDIDEITCLKSDLHIKEFLFNKKILQIEEVVDLQIEELFVDHRIVYKSRKYLIYKSKKYL